MSPNCGPKCRLEDQLLLAGRQNCGPTHTPTLTAAAKDSRRRTPRWSSHRIFSDEGTGSRAARLRVAVAPGTSQPRAWSYGLRELSCRPTCRRQRPPPTFGRRVALRPRKSILWRKTLPPHMPVWRGRSRLRTYSIAPVRGGCKAGRRRTLVRPVQGRRQLPQFLESRSQDIRSRKQRRL